MNFKKEGCNEYSLKNIEIARVCQRSKGNEMCNIQTTLREDHGLPEISVSNNIQVWKKTDKKKKKRQEKDIS